MLASKEVTRISILSRRPVPAAETDPRVRVLLHKDFSTYDTSVLEQLRGANGVVEYIKITKDWPLAAAKAFDKLPQNNDPFRFVYVSGGGATQTPTLFTSLYGRVKGETELELSRLCNDRLRIESVRPVGVDASSHEAIKPYIPDPGVVYKVMGLAFLPLIRTVMRSMHSPTQPLGDFLVQMAMGKYDEQLALGGDDIHTLPGGSRVLDNWAFRRFYGLK
ncbi:hypothetical protein E8E14_005694 [Neopestalotiopsis sp. 37M]|nr:hypothetical protein E8E14_005694 [Neopestalotiopsis sp. 37M]